jgi:hypothetical protein
MDCAAGRRERGEARIMYILQLKVEVYNDVLELKFPTCALGVAARVLPAPRNGPYHILRLITAIDI